MKTNEFDQKLIQVVPTERQVALQQMEFYSFVHFTVNTFTGKEWGDGTEDPAVFNPTRLDARQWVKAVKSAGMKGLILTCKHHDGFCLWPSKYTEHSVAASPFRGGKGDLVREVSDACREAGLRFGVYLSPWDRNNKTYGQGKPYNDYFVNQLTELLTNYGDICTVWFDGACGEGANGKKQVYDWERYYEVIRRLQPGACIHICGPDIRWCGNEAGDTREAEWSVVPERMKDTEKVAADSQQSDDASFRQKKLTARDKDLGSRSALQGEDRLIWYPAEVDTSIRPGWFYHEEEDDRVRSLEELIHIYETAVGGNAMLLLNIPPDKEGLFHENDCRRLAEIGEYLSRTYGENLLEKAAIRSDSKEEGHGIESVRIDGYDDYYKTEDGIRTAEIYIDFPEPVNVSHVVMKENIRLSQRIEAFEILDETEKCLYKGSVVGYKKIAAFEEVKTGSLKIRILDSRVCPTLSFIGVY